MAAEDIRKLYQDILRREPDEGGFQHYQGQVAGGRSIEDIRREIATSPEAVRRNQEQYDRSQQASQYERERDEARIAAEEYQSQLDDYERQLGNYKDQIGGLTTQYNQALGQVTGLTGQLGEAQASANRFEDMFNERTAEYETARDEAQRYRDEAVGRQLQGLRMGSTVSGSNVAQGGIASLAGGRAGVRAADDRAVEIEKNIQAESGALSGKGGPVVERIRQARPTGGSAQAQRQSSPTGTSSYYASRFR